MKILMTVFLLLSFFSYGDSQWTGMPFVQEDHALKLTDDTAEHGLYLLSRSPVPIDRKKSWSLSAEVRTLNVTGRSLIYLFVYDKTDQRIFCFATNSVSGTHTDFQKLYLKISSEQWPENAVSVRLALQPAASPASETGTAWFRNIRFSSTEPPVKLPGRDISQEFVIKNGNCNISDRNLNITSFAAVPGVPRLEFMHSSEHRPSCIQLITEEKIGSISLSVWNEEDRYYEPSVPARLKEVAGGYVLNLEELPPWRKLAVEMPDNTDLLLTGIKILAPEYPEENWQAYWIWFTEDRIENIVIYLRGEFNLDIPPAKAMIQGAADDGADVYINGKLLTGIDGRANPPNLDISPLLRPGRNTVTAVVHQARYAAGFLAELDMIFPDGTSRKVITDRSWRYSRTKPAEGWRLPEFNADSWPHCVEITRPPLGGWGKIKYRKNTPGETLELAADPIPDSLSVGQKYRFSLPLKPSCALPEAPVTMQISRNGIRFLRRTIGLTSSDGRPFRLSFLLQLNEFLMPGKYDLSLSVSGYEFTLNGHPYHKQIQIRNSRHASVPDARLVIHNGRPAFAIDGEIFCPVHSARPPSQLTEHARMYGKAGVHIIHLYHKPAWDASGRPDFTEVDMLMFHLLAGDSDGKAFIRLQLRDCLPAWFLKRYPEDAIVFDNGSRGSHVSLASRRWRSIVADYLKALISYVSSTPYADKIIGYIPSEGEEGQWMHYWGSGDPARPGTLTDYSRPMLHAFHAYLKEKYPTNQAFQKAWRQPGLSRENAPIPSRQERIASGIGAFRDPILNRPAIDYAESLSRVVSDGIAFYTKIIKKASRNKALTGVFYGHVIDLGGQFLGEQTGYLDQRRALENKNIDFFMGPLHYDADFRDVGGVGSFDAPCPGSLLLRSKMWINEEDVRTHLTFPAGYAYSIRSAGATDQMLAREIAKTVCSRAGSYYLMFDNMILNWTDDPETMKTIGELQDFAQQATARDGRSTSQIAVFIDADGLTSLRQLPGQGNKDKLMQMAIYQRKAIGRIGAPFDEYLQFDLGNPNLPDYRFYILLNPYHLTEQEAAALEKLSRKEDVRILLLYAPGIFTDRKLDSSFAEKLTGMHFNMETAPRKAEIVLKTGAVNGPQNIMFSPAFLPEGFNEKFAQFRDGKPAVVRKDHFYYAAVPVLTPELLRSIAREAGVEIFSENNIAVYGCAGYLAFHSGKQTGDHVVRAPKNKQMRQIWPLEINAPWIRFYHWQNTKPITRIFELR